MWLSTTDNPIAKAQTQQHENSKDNMSQPAKKEG